MNKKISLILGLFLVFSIGIISFYLSKLDFFMRFKFSSLTLSIVIGIIIGNTFFKKIEIKTDLGVIFAKSHLLKLGIILYGFNITFQEIQELGLKGILIDSLMISIIFSISMFVGVKILKLDKNTSALIGAGSSICGAAAVLATEPVLKAKDYQVSIAIATVVVFGTTSMFLYPFMFEFLDFSYKQFGVYIGSSIHEVAQVVGAGSSVSIETENIAVIQKMIRVMLLAPFLIIISFLFQDKEKDRVKKIHIPYFALIFVLVSALNSLNILPTELIKKIKFLDIILLSMAMSALGLKTHITSLSKAGIKPLILSLVLFVCLISLGYLLVKIIL